MARGFEATGRRVLRLTGGDVRDFLQNLVTNDVPDAPEGLIYAALLTPQGKYLYDFFIFRDGEAWCLDVLAEQADGLAARLGMYKLRADVTIEASDSRVWQIWDSPAGYADPRGAVLGRRVYGQAPEMTAMPEREWDALRVAEMVPEGERELITNDSYILEMDFERLGGVDFRKGCYVGQEVTARMKHKTELRKGLARVEISGPAQPGAEIVADGKVAGRLCTVAGDRALAYLRFDRAGAAMTAGAAEVSWSGRPAQTP